MSLVGRSCAGLLGGVIDLVQWPWVGLFAELLNDLRRNVLDESLFKRSGSGLDLPLPLLLSLGICL